MVDIKKKYPCCGQPTVRGRHPLVTVDAVIEVRSSEGQLGIVLIRRKNPPLGWALPGGFVDYGETVEQAVVREAREETGLSIRLRGLLGVYSAPDRDPRGHTISVVFVAEAEGTPQGADDAERAAVFPLDNLPPELAFDHARILADYRKWRESPTTAPRVLR
ncbi:MAG: NUDIX hydrolase [candidate division KSB1 bacterium]|nr:NUDIX hydrolase [candidate division KSB1 bacterium]